MSYKLKMTKARSRAMTAISLVVFFIGFVLFMDGIYFHWFGDIGELDPTGLSWLHHWHLGFILMLVSFIPQSLIFKE